VPAHDVSWPLRFAIQPFLPDGIIDFSLKSLVLL
jgi:hypothetical protein